MALRQHKTNARQVPHLDGCQPGAGSPSSLPLMLTAPQEALPTSPGVAEPEVTGQRAAEVGLARFPWRMVSGGAEAPAGEGFSARLGVDRRPPWGAGGRQPHTPCRRVSATSGVLQEETGAANGCPGTSAHQIGAHLCQGSEGEAPGERSRRQSCPPQDVETCGLGVVQGGRAGG